MPKVLIPLAEGCEELEAVTIADILHRANIAVVTAGLEKGPVKASHGTTIMPSATLEEALKHDDYDMVVLPGGLPGADHLGNDARLAAFLTHMAASGRYVAAICAAPRILAKLGLLDGKTATAYPGFIDRGDFPKVRHTGAPVERDGKIITGRGPGTAMDFALALTEALAGEQVRATVEKALVRP